jgi:hypothetical protein
MEEKVVKNQFKNTIFLGPIHFENGSPAMDDQHRQVVASNDTNQENCWWKSESVKNIRLMPGH